MGKKPTYEELEQRIRDLERGKSTEKGLCSTVEDQESMCRLIMENISDTVIVTDDQGNMLYVCPNTTIIFGLSQDQVYNQQTIQRLMNGTVCDISELKDQHEIKGIEWSITNSYGKTRCLTINAKSVSINGGTVLYVMHDITERKRYEEAMRENQEILRAFLNSAPDIIGISDTQGINLEANEALAKSLDIKLDDLRGICVWDLLPPESAYSRKQYFEQVIQTGKAIHFEDERAGIYFDNIFFPVFDIQGKVIKIGAIARDITERKQAAEERHTYLSLLESLDQVNRALQGTTDLEQMMKDILDVVLSVFDCDRASLVYPCDPKAATWQAPMERIREPYKGVLALGLQVPMDDEVAWCHRLLRSSDGPVPFGLEYENQMPVGVGERFQIRSQLGMAIYPKDDKPWMFVIHQCSHSRLWQERDIRLFQEIGRRLADVLTTLLMFRNLRESEEKYRTLSINIPGMIYRAMPDWSVEIISNSEIICGYSINEFATQKVNWLDLIHRDDKQQIFEEGSKLSKKQMAIVQEYRILAKDGSTHWVSDHKASFIKEDGSFISIDGIVYDITERKRMEEELASREREYRTLVESIPDFIARFDKEVRHLYVNPSISRAFGVPLEQIIGKTLRELPNMGSPVQIETLISKVKEVFERGTPNIAEACWVTQKGECFF